MHFNKQYFLFSYNNNSKCILTNNINSKYYIFFWIFYVGDKCWRPQLHLQKSQTSMVIELAVLTTIQSLDGISNYFHVINHIC